MWKICYLQVGLKCANKTHNFCVDHFRLKTWIMSVSQHFSRGTLTWLEAIQRESLSFSCSPT